MALADVPVELIERCQKGEQTAYDELFQLIHEDLYRLIFSMVRHEDDTYEIMQESFIRIFRHLPRLKESKKFKSWVSRLVVNQTHTHWSRSNRRRADSLDDILEAPDTSLILEDPQDKDPRRHSAKKELYENVNEAIRELPPRQRTAVMLFDVKGFTIREIAEKLECSEGAVKFNIFQGRRKLRELLTEYLDEHGKIDLTELE